MAVNPAYLIECALYEKCLKETTQGDYVSEFQRAFPQLFNGPFAITSEIEDLDHYRKKLVAELDKIDVATEADRYNDAEDAIWYAYRYEVNAFYEANQPKLDAIIERYQQFLNKDDEQETVLFKIVRTPAGYWLATKQQSWLVAREPFELRYACKALWVQLYRWLKRLLKGLMTDKGLNQQSYAA